MAGLFINLNKMNEKQKANQENGNDANRLLCAVKFYRMKAILKPFKGKYYGTEIEISKRDIHFGNRDYKIGEERKYEYACTCCDFRKIKIKGYTYLGDYERWEKKTYV